MQLPQTKDSFNYSCAEIQKADGISHPLLKLSVLNLLRLRLESEVQFGQDYLIVFVANLSFGIVIVNYANDVFSECIACANCPTFVTTKFTEGSSIGSRVDVSVSGLVKVAYMQAIGARFVSGSAFPSEVCIPAVFTRFFAIVFMIFIAPHIFSSKGEVRSEVVACANVPDFFVTNYSEMVSSIIPETGIISLEVVYIYIHFTKISRRTNYIKTIRRRYEIFFRRSFTNHTVNLYFIAIGKFSTINVAIKYVTGIGYFVPTACVYINTANTAVYISTVQFNFIFAAFTVHKFLGVLEHTGVSPVFINLAGYPKTSTKVGFVSAVVAAYIVITDLAGNFYVVRFFLKVSNANAEAFEFVSKFCCQFVYVSAFSHSFSNNLSHFITGHQFVAAVGAVGITVNYTSSCQFVYCVISPMTCRYIGERICGISACSYAKSHSHCEN